MKQKAPFEQSREMSFEPAFIHIPTQNRDTIPDPPEKYPFVIYVIKSPATPTSSACSATLTAQKPTFFSLLTREC